MTISLEKLTHRELRQLVVKISIGAEEEARELRAQLAAVQRENKILKAQNKVLTQRVAALEATVAELREEIRRLHGRKPSGKNSSNSSKPPSTDEPRERTKRSRSLREPSDALPGGS